MEQRISRSPLSKLPGKQCARKFTIYCHSLPDCKRCVKSQIANDKCWWARLFSHHIAPIPTANRAANTLFSQTGTALNNTIYGKLISTTPLPTM